MKQYIIIILIALHLIVSNVYAKNTFLKQNHINTNTYQCAIDEHIETHEHHHFHNNSNHTHKHSHSQATMNFLDFYTYVQDKNSFAYSTPADGYFETASWKPNPILGSLFRPPIV